MPFPVMSLAGLGKFGLVFHVRLLEMQRPQYVQKNLQEGF